MTESATPISDAALGSIAEMYSVAQELERKVVGLEAAARFWQEKFGQEVADVRANEIESLRARNDKLDAELTNERMLHYAAESEVKAETKRCVQVARDFPFSPANGRAIAALIMEGR